jgi:hypothetical protein
MPLAACQTAPSEPVTRCPPLTSYSAAFQRLAAEELKALPPGAALGILVVDYGKIRDACRSL